MNLSVIICTHNPREQVLSIVLNALSRQGGEIGDWELLIIDNASDPSLQTRLDLGWHPRARIIREDRLGVFHARYRGIVESAGDLIVFVDDDNVLASDYLANCRSIAAQYPTVGAWGAGDIVPEFEAEPPKRLRPSTQMLTWRAPAGDLFSNKRHMNPSVPSGAGMCVRRVVAATYAQLASVDERRRMLGRRGGERGDLMSSEDIDIALVACDIGLRTGVFDRLKMRHLISAGRVQEPYLLRFAEAVAYSVGMFHSIRYPVENQSMAWLWFRRRFLPYLKAMLLKRGFERRLSIAKSRGGYRANRLLLETARASSNAGINGAASKER